MHALRPFKSRTPSCRNLNHARPNAPIGHCPDCGRVVNVDRVLTGCSAEKHAAARRRQSAYCAHCGEHLIAVSVR